MSELLIEAVQNTWAITYSYMLFRSFLEPQKKWRLPQKAAILFCIGIFYSIVGGYFEKTYMLTTWMRTLGLSFRTILSFIMILQLFHGTRVKKGFLLVFAVTLGVISELLAMFFYLWGKPYVMVEQIPEAEVGVIVFFSFLIAYLIVFIIIWTRRNKKPATKSTGLYLMEMVIPCASVCLLLLSFKHIEKDDLVIIGIFIIVVNLAAYFLFDRLEHYFMANQEYAMQEQQHRLMESYYQQMEVHQKEIRLIKHDLKNQLIALSAAFESSPQSSGHQLDELIGQLSRQTEYDFTGHPGINAILGMKYRQAQELSIVCDWEVKVPADIGFKDTDLAIVIGNVLDNAIEACQYCSGTPYIRFQMIYYQGSLVLNSENSTDEQAGRFATRKKDKRNHGLGIESIRAVADKYHGQMEDTFNQHCYQIGLTVFEPEML